MLKVKGEIAILREVDLQKLQKVGKAFYLLSYLLL